MDRALAESQMGTGNAAGLSGVVCEVSLGIQISVVADDLDGALVGTDCTVGTKTVEQAACVVGIDCDVNRSERQICYVVIDTDRELFLRIVLLEFFEDTVDMGRVGVLGRQTVTAADDCQILMLSQCIAYIEEQRFSCALFLGSVKNSNLLDGCRQNIFQILLGERTIQINLDQTDLFASLTRVLIVSVIVSVTEPIATITLSASGAPTYTNGA